MRTFILLFAARLTALRDWLFPPAPPEPDLGWLRRMPKPNYRPRLRTVPGRCYLCGYRGRVIAQDGDEADVR
jgi:hypothetical protein